MTLVKICGITHMEDLKMCLKAGADITGFNLYPKSARHIALKELKSLTEVAAERSALVTVNKGLEDLIRIIGGHRVGYVQLHGSEDAGYMRSIKKKFPEIKLIKKVTVEMKDEFESLLRRADYLLCDVKSPFHGGTGMKFDWRRLEELPRGLRKKIFVAGGVTPENVHRLRGKGLAGVDVASGSECSPGIKDPLKVKQIIQRISEFPRKD